MLVNCALSLLRRLKMKSLSIFLGFFAILWIFTMATKLLPTNNRNYRTYLLTDRKVLYYVGFQQRFTEDVNCKAIFNGDHEAAGEAVHTNKKFIMEDKEIAKVARNCTSLKKLGYITKPVSHREANFPIAYSILMYKNVSQVEFLLRVIYRPQNAYCIHVDKYASRDVTDAVEGIVKCFDNVFLVSEPVGIVYAGFSRLQADINCMKDLLKVHKNWKYFINLSGQMFPLKSNEEMVRILEIYNGANDIEYVGLGSRFTGRFHNKFVENNTASVRRLISTSEKNPPLPFGLKYVKGSAYGIFSRAFVRFILEDKMAKALLEWSKNTYSPDEMFWSTLHHVGHNPQLHTPGGYNGTEIKRHPWLATYASWGGVDPCYSKKYAHGICIFGAEDLPALSKRKEFTINKLFLDFQPVTMLCLAEKLWNKTFSPLNDTDFEYYRQLPFILPKRNH